MRSVFLNKVNKRRYGIGSRTALSIDKDFDPAENVNVLSSTVGRLQRARVPFLCVKL